MATFEQEMQAATERRNAERETILEGLRSAMEQHPDVLEVSPPEDSVDGGREFMVATAGGYDFAVTVGLA